MRPIIRSIRRYLGTAHPWATGQRVVVIAVHRGDSVLKDDAEIGTLKPDDEIEFLPAVNDGLSWVSSDASPTDLGPVEGVYEGEIPVGRMIG